MGLFNKSSENRERQRETEKQRLMALSEKELIVEILLKLEELNEQSKAIMRNQVHLEVNDD